MAATTHIPGKVYVAGKTLLTVTKKNPGQSTLPGLCRLLPQLVGSYDPGGGVSGDGNAARVGPINSDLSRAIYPRNVAAVQSLITVRGG